MCVGGGGGGIWASSFQVILGFLVVSLQFEPADVRVLVKHPVPRCPSGVNLHRGCIFVM